MTCHSTCTYTRHSRECSHHPDNINFTKVIAHARIESRIKRMIDPDNLRTISTNLPLDQLEGVLCAVHARKVTFDKSTASVVDESSSVEFALDGRRYALVESFGKVTSLTLLGDVRSGPEDVPQPPGAPLGEVESYVTLEEVQSYITSQGACLTEATKGRTSKFRRDLAELLNANSMEAGSDTPDFVLAEFMADCLTAFDMATQARDVWYSKDVLRPKGEVK